MPAAWARSDWTNGGLSRDVRTGGDQEGEAEFELVGEVDGWQGRAPDDIEGEENPTLALEPGTQYSVTWENGDGVEHDFTILDADGNEITSTETTSTQGETRSLTFEATAEMAEYVCTVHPERMQGGIQIQGETPTPETPTEARQEVETEFELGAEIGGWQGQAPDDIEGEENPTLELEAGVQYRVTWENLDGVMHNFTILDVDGNEITSTETMSREGEARSLTFTATREMAQYYCGVHTDAMRGDVRVAETTPTDDTPTEADADVEIRFELGAVIGGWQGRLPEEEDHEQRIDGEQNPTLELEAGTRYMAVWENADGVPHNFTIQDDGGSDILATETVSRQGAKRSLTFTATPEMSRYVCTIHPETMRGEIGVSGGGLANRFASGPEGTAGSLIAATAAVVGGLGYALSKYFQESTEP